MNKLKEQNGKYYNKCQIHLLSTTQNPTPISQGNFSKELEYHKFLFGKKDGIYSNHTFQHLYFTSDEEIKEGDYCLFYGDISKVLEVNDTHAKIETYSTLSKTDLGLLKGLHPNSKAKIGDKTTIIHSFSISQLPKIIATTDTSLKLPQPSKQFIQKYIEEYNNGNKIEEVLVEYKYVYETILEGQLGFPEDSDSWWVHKLKTDSHNTITIKPIKDTYTKEEVENILFRYAEQHGLTSTKGEIDEFNDWIKENL